MSKILSQKIGSIPRCAPHCARGFLFAGALLFLLTCGAPRQESVEPSLLIAAAIFPLADWCKNIAPEGTEILTLIPPNQNPHTFEPSMRDAKRLSRARLVVRMGYGYDDWIESLIESTRSDNTEVLVLEKAEAASTFEFSQEPADPVLEASTDIAAVSEEHAEETSREDLHEDHRHDQGAENPHLWLDPIWAQDAVRMISERLRTLLPDQAQVIEERTQNYLLQLAELHQKLASEIGNLPYKTYVGYHGAFIPFAERYGLTEAASIEIWAGKEPSLDHTKKVVDLLKGLPKPVIFVEPQISQKAAEVFAQEGGCPVLVLDPIGNPDAPERDTYIKMMEFNLNSFKQGLSEANAQ